MKFLFWNTGRKDVDDVLASLARTDGIDVFLLAEYVSGSNDFLSLVNRGAIEDYKELPQIGCRRITIFCRSEIGALLDPCPESEYYRTYCFEFPDDYKVLMVAVHLPSKTNQSDRTQTLEASEFRKEIELIEDQLKIENTFIVGDFNMNPFEDGMVAASAFHSVPSKKVSAERERTIKGRPHKYFYNPMWNLFGDHDDNPGTYFYRDSEQTVYFWNMLDQIILRPAVQELLVDSSLRIIREVNGQALVNSHGKPGLSDHLPIAFDLDFERRNENEESVA